MIAKPSGGVNLGREERLHIQLHVQYSRLHVWCSRLTVRCSAASAWEGVSVAAAGCRGRGSVRVRV